MYKIVFGLGSVYAIYFATVYLVNFIFERYLVISTILVSISAPILLLILHRYDSHTSNNFSLTDGRMINGWMDGWMTGDQDGLGLRNWLGIGNMTTKFLTSFAFTLSIATSLVGLASLPMFVLNIVGATPNDLKCAQNFLFFHREYHQMDPCWTLPLFAQWVLRPIPISMHIVGGAVTLVLGAMQLYNVRGTVCHKWRGRIYIIGNIFSAIGVIYLAIYTVLGIPGFILYISLVLYWLMTLTISIYYIVYSTSLARIDKHREWALRNFAATWTAPSFRLYSTVLALFYVPIDPPYFWREFIGGTLSLGNLVLVEIYIRYSRQE